MSDYRTYKFSVIDNSDTMPLLKILDVVIKELKKEGLEVLKDEV